MVIMVAIYIIFTAIFTGIKVPANLVNPIWTNAFIYIGVFLGLVVVVILHFFNRYAIFWPGLFGQSLPLSLINSVCRFIERQFGSFVLFNVFDLRFCQYCGSIYFHHDGRKLFEDKTHIRVLKVVSIILGVCLLISRIVVLYIRGTQMTNLFSVMQFVSLFMTVAIVSYMIYAFYNGGAVRLPKSNRLNRGTRINLR